MKAIYIANYGALDEVVQMGDLPNPAVGPQDVLIQVRAAGVNPIDWKIAEGYMKDRIPLVLPAILGNEVAGVIIEAGSATSRFKKGGEVYARLDPLRGGGYAEYVAVDAKFVAPKPEVVDFVAAAAIPLAGLTAWQVLFEHLKLKKGQKVLIHAGSGGVGSFAIQFAKHIGAEVATTVGPDGVKLAKTLGADHVIDYKSRPFEDVVKDFDAVFDTVGGETQALDSGLEARWRARVDRRCHCGPDSRRKGRRPSARGVHASRRRTARRDRTAGRCRNRQADH